MMKIDFTPDKIDFTPDKATPAPKPKVAPPKSPDMSYLGPMFGPMEAGANMLSGMVAWPASKLAEANYLLNATIYHMMHPKTWVTADPMGPQKEAERVQQALTYEPHTPAGKAIAKYNPLNLIGEAANVAGQKVQSGITSLAPKSTPMKMLASGAREFTKDLPLFVGGKVGEMAKTRLAKMQEALNIAKGQNIRKDLVNQKAAQLGLPLSVDPNSLYVKIFGEKRLNEANLPKANRVAKDAIRSEFNMPKNSPVDPIEMAKIREKAGNPYRALIAAGDKITSKIQEPGSVLGPDGKPMMVTKTVSGFTTDPEFLTPIHQELSRINDLLSKFPNTFKTLKGPRKILEDYADTKNMSPQEAISAIKTLREDAAANFKSRKPLKLATAFTQREVASQLENMIERNLAKSGQTKLLADVKAARKTIAKTYEVQNAMDANGDINLRKMAALAKKGSLTDNLKTLADYAAEHPEMTRKAAPRHALANIWDYVLTAAGHPGIAALDVGGKLAAPIAAKRAATYMPPNYSATSLTGAIAPPVGMLSTTTEKKRKPPQ